MEFRSLALLAFIAISPVCHAAQNTVDRTLASCLSKNTSTAGMVSCTNQAALLWDKGLNSIYTKLMAGLEQSDKETLRNSQRQWIAFRDSEFKAIDAIYRNVEGSMYLPMRAADRLYIVKSRALQLESYSSLIN